MGERRFQVKPRVLDVMRRRFPEYPYAFTKDPRYFFQSQPIDAIYEYVVFQRNGRSGAFYIDLAATYDPEWEGFGPYPLGRWDSLAKLVKVGTKGYIDAMENWYFYGDSQERLEAVLDQIATQVTSHGKPYYVHVRKVLRSDRVLQAGLRLLREEKPVSVDSLLRLDSNLKQANYLLRDTKDETLDQIVRQIRAKLSFPARFRAEEGYVRKVACDLLFLGRNHEIRAKSSAHPPPA